MPFWPGAGPGVQQRRRTAPGAFASQSVVPPPTQQTIQFKSRVQATTARTIPFKSRIQKTTAKTILFQSRVTATMLQTIGFVSRVTATTLQAIPFKSRVRATTQQQITFRSRIGPPNLAVQPAAAPALVASYGGFALDDSNGIILSTPYDTADTDIYGNWYTEFRCRIRKEEETGNEATDDALFNKRIQALEALRVPRQRLLVTLAGNPVRDLDFNTTTPLANKAFLITTELEVKIMNRRDYTYGFRVRNQVPFPLPTSFFRRESDTALTTTLRENRSCEITAVWTASPGKTSLDNYADQGGTFFDAFLPAVGKDQYGTTGQWIRLDESPVKTNDERSLTAARRVYVECFAGRRDSGAAILTTIGNRRVLTAPSTWLATPGSTALQNYNSNSNAFYFKLLSTYARPFGSGYEWVLVAERPYLNDQVGVVTVERVYHEVQSGLREFTVDVSKIEEQVRHVRVRGTFYSTISASAFQNFTNGLAGLVAQVKNQLTPPMTLSAPITFPEAEGYDQNQLRYQFDFVIREIPFPYGHSAVTIQSLFIQNTKPFDPQSISDANPVSRLQGCLARFTASIDRTKITSPIVTWETIRPYVLAAVTSQLGGDVSSVEVIDEVPSVDLSRWTVSGVLLMVVTGGSLLWCRLRQRIRELPGARLHAQGDGQPLSYWWYRIPAWKFMHREAEGEYVLGGAAPVFFAAGDNKVSGFGFEDTGISAPDALAEWRSGTPREAPNWYLNPDTFSYDVLDVPTTRGLEFQTVVVQQLEDWVFAQTLKGNSPP